jgi:hypothetical protein
MVTKGYMEIENSLESNPLTGIMRAVFHGRDDEGNSFSLDVYVSGN